MNPGAPEVEVVVLGVVQDGGLPQIGDHCPRCEAARRDPARRGRVASIGLIDRRDRRAYVFDASPDLPAQWDHLLEAAGFPRRASRTPPDGIYLTHAHAGHYAGLVHLGREAFGARGVPVHGTASMIRFLRENEPWRQLVEIGNIAPREVRPGEPVRIREGLTVTAIPSPHRAEHTDTVGYRIEAGRSLLYVPDTDRWSAWSPGIEETVRGVDLAILDGTFHSADEIPGREIDEIPHPLAIDTARRLEAVLDERPGTVFLIHMNHTNPILDDTSRERREIEASGLRVAARGMRFPL